MAKSGSKLGRLLGSEKPPFFLALFVAALAWTITRYADSLSATPVIEYDVTSSGKNLSVSLENLSQNKTFNNLVFLLRSAEGPLTKPRLTPTQPAWEGTIHPSCTGETCEFTICQVPAGMEI